jgi:hypothetical protein
VRCRCLLQLSQKLDHTRVKQSGRVSFSWSIPMIISLERKGIIATDWYPCTSQRPLMRVARYSSAVDYLKGGSIIQTAVPPGKGERQKMKKCIRLGCNARLPEVDSIQSQMPSVWEALGDTFPVPLQCQGTLKTGGSAEHGLLDRADGMI